MNGVDILEAGVDYLTLHTPEWGDYRQCSMDQLVDEYKRVNLSPVALKVSNRLGYTGIGDDHFFIGEREDGYYREIKSAYADYLYIQTVIPSDKPSRIDVQVTIRIENDIAEQIDIHKGEAEVANMPLPDKRKRLLSGYDDSKGGKSLYICSRSSDQYAIIYNKEARSGEETYQHCLRYEVRLKNEYAHAIASSLICRPSERHRRCACIVKDWLKERGVIVPFGLRGYEWTPPKPALPQTNVDSTMRWLRDQVAPAIVKLEKHVDRSAILSALGIVSRETDFIGPHEEKRN